MIFIHSDKHEQRYLRGVAVRLKLANCSSSGAQPLVRIVNRPWLPSDLSVMF